MVVIYRQELLNDISFFTSQPKAKFYDNLFMNLDLSAVPSRTSSKGRCGFDNHSLICAFIVMKCEGFSQITDLVDFLNNNLIIAHYCGFDILKPLPSYTKFQRFIKNISHDILHNLMDSQVLKAHDLALIDTSFIGLDSTPVFANTSHNNPKAFKSSKFNKDNHPSCDKDCGLGVHTASNQYNEKNFSFYWGYKNHVLVDCISGLPIYDVTTTADVYDSTVAVDILAEVNSFLPVSECTFIADKGYDVKDIYNTVKDVYLGDCFIPLNKRNTKKPDKLPCGHLICDAGLAMHRDGKTRDSNRIRQKFCCPLKNSKTESCPCNHKNWNNGKKHRGCTKYITIPNDYRLQIDRHSIAFKAVYALRTECERYNSRFKDTGQERIWVRNIRSVENLNTIAHIALLSIAIAAVVTMQKTTMRSRKRLMRSA